MSSDEAQPWAAATRLAQPSTAIALLRIARLNEAETADIRLFIAPGRLQVAQRMLMAGLFWPGRLADPAPCNDN